MNKHDVIRFIEDQSEEIENLRAIIREDVKIQKAAQKEKLDLDNSIAILKNWHKLHCLNEKDKEVSHVFSVELSWTPTSIVKIGKCSCGEFCDLSQVREK